MQQDLNPGPLGILIGTGEATGTLGDFGDHKPDLTSQVSWDPE